ncbi:small nucleolar RNP protein Sm [Aeropyrum pernix K1]|uniref:Putative snRNP Sm-like protein n=1 Tax=Aeropyrum pernix (strain ATCC 700893 / DSM 11879 / JCM 9820 / NBRC 100138 / K1) TaxID=272557 RepID=RUXX_AERPE|nr:LSm family protein [Aeropyrum pernix]Q9YEQ5.1 RecName: Full=Putative snRNP Sm-like protein [Aeropyrum pernix K1]BAA79491.1 small nucleolar RNP protein Sm [Aeropyrum pernix K1]
MSGPITLPTLRMMLDYVDTPVLVKLKSGLRIKGVLKTYDQHLNIILGDAEEIGETSIRRLGLTLVRGDSVVVITPAA